MADDFDKAAHTGAMYEENTIITLIFTLTNGTSSLTSLIHQRFGPGITLDNLVSPNVTVGEIKCTKTDCTRVIHGDSESIAQENVHQCLSTVAVYVTKEVLISKSRYFYAMFSSDTLEHQTSTVYVQDINVLDFLHLAKHLFKEVHIVECEICKPLHEAFDSVYNLFSSAMYFQCETGLRILSQELTKVIGTNACLLSLCVSYLVSDSKLYSKALRYALYYCEELYQQISDLLLGEHAFCITSLLKHPKLNLDHHSKSSKLQNIIKTALQDDERVNYCQQPLCAMRVEFNKPKDGSSVNLICNESLTVCHSSGDISGELAGCSIPHQLFGTAIAAFGKDLYLASGEIGVGRGKWNQNIYHFDTISRQWVVLPNKLSEPNRHSALCCSSKALYMLGGFNKFRIKLSAVWKFCLDSEGAAKRLPELPDGFFAKVAVVDADDSMLIVETDVTDGILVLDLQYSVDDNFDSCASWKRVAELENDLQPKSKLNQLLAELEVKSRLERNQVKLLWYPDYTIPG